MGTNFYMRLKKPKVYERPLSEVADWRYEGMLADPDAKVEIVDREAVHIAKTSWGWVPSFQHVPAKMAFDETEANNDKYSIKSVDDIRGYMATGDYEIADEDGDVIDMDEFERRVVRWCDVQREGGFQGEFGNHVDVSDSLDAYVDGEGNQFCKTCFC